ncbi:MAG: hypothetical protein L0H55_12895, partial [Candidatus Nitrosocosmicus sp.]|nr:hypothetical protein [Candidatus Nitrosocosmicus sp.]
HEELFVEKGLGIYVKWYSRALYLYFLGLSTRCVAKAIFYLLKVKRSHISIWKGIQICHPRKISSQRERK